MKTRKLSVFCVSAVCLLLSGWTSPWAGQRSNECLVTVKTYIISGTAGKERLSFPLFPNMSLAVLEETISDLDIYYEKLRTLYAFTEYRLLAMASAQVRLTGFPHPIAIRVGRDQVQPPGPWTADWRDFRWDSEGRLQMQVKIVRGAETFIESHISVLPGRSVILGRFADQSMTEADFVIVVPQIDVAAVEGASAVERAPDAGSKPMAQQQKIGLPPPAPPESPASSPSPEGLMDGEPYVEAAELPTVVSQVSPEYPEAAQQEKIEGNVWLKSMIDETGAVRRCIVARSSGRADLDSAAVRAGRKSTYTPARDKSGKSLGIWIAYQVVFKLW